MTPDDKRLKEIKHRQWEIEQEKKKLDKESKALTREKLQIEGYHRIERSRKAYKSRKRGKQNV
jgi:hypothetical protein